MNKKNILLFIIAIIVTACSSSIKEKLGLNDRTGPDEFNVISNPPLSMPPNFDLDNPQNGSDSHNNSNKILFPSSKNMFENSQTLTQGESLLLNKADIEIDRDYKSILDSKNKQNKKQNFFQKLFNKKNDLAKDATENPAANEEDRIYKSKSLQLMKSNNSMSSNRKICNIDNGEVVYCDKNTFMKSFSFSASPPKSQ